jgi:hypothetical protein
MGASENNSNGDDGDDDTDGGSIVKDFFRLFKNSPKNVSVSPRLNLVNLGVVFPRTDLKKGRWKLNLNGQTEKFLGEVRKVEMKIINDLKKNNNFRERSPSSLSASPFVFFSNTPASTSASASTSAPTRIRKFILYFCKVPPAINVSHYLTDFYEIL